MNTRTAAFLAWSIWALSLACTALGLLLHSANAPSLSFSFLLLAFLGFPTVGVLIVSRRPMHPIGWIFCIAGLSFSAGAFAQDYAVYTLVTKPGSLPAGEAMGWVGLWAHAPALLMVTFLFLLFPDGRLPSQRWRPVAWLAAGLIALEAMWWAFTPRTFNADPYARIQNPLGIESARDVFELVDAIKNPLTLAVALVCVISVIRRFRRARGEERQQLKWFAYAAALLIAAAAIGNILQRDPANIPVRDVLMLPAVLALPISIGIAILKYRLYDIDVIVNRTLVYSVLSGALVLVYYVSVVLLQALFRALTGQEQSPVVTVISTLAIAALFAPLRRRVQDAIDRRFYRKKYDAAKTLADFATTVRDEVELDKLAERLVQVVEETMQPASVSLWLQRTAVGKERRTPEP